VSWWWALPLVPALAAVLSLLAPWFYSGARPRSSIDLLASAGALDLVEGPVRLGVVLVWLLVPLLVAAAILAAAARRFRLSAALVVPVGIIAVPAASLLLVSLGDAAGWGAWASAGFGLLSTVLAIGVLVRFGRASASGAR
jgi:hypothetical protein